MPAPKHADKLHYVSALLNAEAGKSMAPVFEAEVSNMERKFPSLINLNPDEFEALAIEASELGI